MRAGTHHAPEGRDRIGDLASLVVASAGTRADRRPRRGSSSARSTQVRGMDAGAVVALALVVAALAGIAWWAIAAINDADGVTRAPASAASASAASSATGARPDAASTAGAPAGAGTADGAATVEPAVPGVQLAASQLSATRTDGVLRVVLSVRNDGAAALGGGRGVQVAFLVDGQLAATQQLGAVTGTGRADVAWTPGTCTPGRHSVAAVVDASAQVREADERDNAASADLRFTC